MARFWRPVYLVAVILVAASAASCGEAKTGDAVALTPAASVGTPSAAGLPSQPPLPTKKDIRDAFRTVRAFVVAVDSGDQAAAKRRLSEDAEFALADVMGELNHIRLTDKPLYASVAEVGGASRTTLEVTGAVAVEPSAGSTLKAGTHDVAFELHREAASDPWGVYYVAFR